MNKQHNELFVTLHQLAATVTTVFEVLADVKPEDRSGSGTATSSPRPEPEPSQPPEPRRGDACLACGRACEGLAAQVKHGRICGTCIDGSLDDIRRQLERARLEEIAGCIGDQLTVLRRFAHEAIDLDGARTLPILDREVTRLCDLYRSRRGPFEEASKTAGVLLDDADLDLSTSCPEQVPA